MSARVKLCIDKLC